MELKNDAPEPEKENDLDVLIPEKPKRSLADWMQIVPFFGLFLTMVGVFLVFMATKGRLELLTPGKIIGFTGGGIYILGRAVSIFLKNRGPK